MVRSVITLGSPFRSQPGDHTAVEQLWRMTTVRSRPQIRRLIVDEENLVLAVPSTAIYSRTDGIVAWQLCIESEGPLRESIEVRSSHSGMAVNPSALYAVADRLAQPEGRWRPFRPPVGMRHLYPPAATYATPPLTAPLSTSKRSGDPVRPAAGAPRATRRIAERSE